MGIEQTIFIRYGGRKCEIMHRAHNDVSFAEIFFSMENM